MNFEREKVFLTVGTKEQKALCEKIVLSLSLKSSFDIKVIADDDMGGRLGSGGALLNILKTYYKKGDKILIINSGGMSKRAVNYALKGKAFANVMCKSETKTLFELILEKSENLMRGFSSGVLICCSDILVDIDDVDIVFSDSTGVALRADFQVASRHGVMLCKEDNILLEYLHKRPVDELKKLAEKINTDSMLIDTGITYFSGALTEKLYEISCDDNYYDALTNHKFEIGLYSDIINLMSANCTFEEYIKRETENVEHLNFKKMLYRELSGFSMNVFTARNQKFLHFGSTAEALENSFYIAEKQSDNLILNSYISEDSRIGKGTLLDSVQLNNCCVGENCLISDVSLENLDIRDGKAVCGVKLKDGSFACIICDVTENPKDIVNASELWETPRYYKGDSYTESLDKYYSNKKEERYSMAYCMENADLNYFMTRQQYLKDMQDYTVSADYLKKRQEIIEHYFASRAVLEKVECTKDKVEEKLPLRINLSGTWTDAMPYCIDNGGQVINMAIKVEGEKPVTVLVEKLEGRNDIEFSSDSAIAKFSFENDGSNEDLSEFNLHRAVLVTVGITEATIIKDGFRLTTDVRNIDKGSGLGTSSILLGGCFKALGKMFSLDYSDAELLKMVFVAEQIMKTGGGWQDQVGGLTPGLKAGTTLAGLDQELMVTPIHVSEFFQQLFSERVVLMPTGQRHFGRFIVNDVANRYLDGNPESIEGHKKIRELNDDLAQSFESDDYIGFINCINTHRELLKNISHKVTNSEIEKLVSKCFEKADAISYLGAGGGGYLLVVLNETTTAEEFRSFVKVNFPTISSEIKKVDICYDI